MFKKFMFFCICCLRDWAVLLLMSIFKTVMLRLMKKP